jgi:hypothetical protein
MDLGDLVRIAFILMIASFILWRRRRRKTLPGIGLGQLRPARRPTALSESGGYERTFPQPPARRALRAGTNRGEALREAFGSRPSLAESRQARHDAIARGLRAGSMPTAEEQPRGNRLSGTPAPSQATPRTTSIRDQLASPQSVRTAFVLREVLDRPVGMRENT